MAASLKKQAGVDVEVIDGARGEFTVSVDGKVVAQKGQSMPTEQEVLAAVRSAAPVTSGA